MKSVNNRIIVSVNMAQKNEMVIGDINIKTALLWESNYRERSPVVAKVITGNDVVKEGDIICCHHNHFCPPSPYYLYDDLFSIPFGNTIFGVFDNEGNLSPRCGNIFGSRVQIPSTVELPPELVKTYIDRVIVTDGRNTKYKNGELVLCRKYAPYDIVYNWNGIEKRVTKVNTDMIVGVVS